MELVSPVKLFIIKDDMKNKKVCNVALALHKYCNRHVLHSESDCFRIITDEFRFNTSTRLNMHNKSNFDVH